MTSAREHDTERFYALLAELEQRVGGRRQLGECHGRQVWPQRGVYFCFEPGETRRAAPQSRVVRIGTHALIDRSQTTLWKRLLNHRGTGSGGGNHRGSIFRQHVGFALQARDDLSCPTWGVDPSAPSAIRQTEEWLEQRVSQVLGATSVLWLAIDDQPGPQSLRGEIERGSIALLSGLNEAGDAPSANWLGRHARSETIRRSGLWNISHTSEDYPPRFLDTFERLIRSQPV
ncbi:hypothetical protein FNU79_17610 [Deinococcus detaillensis]|uniref:GIY-YIG domain-containing protein n=1 Tax=Deinococcus detaillensis TaxID=2592048 RepID=A0A553UHI2_9DEIO|nr:hypothetical protein [Deinococcus detaillensis]TSA79652.1 hypothetical protein FNU79_17610 [Deinococcus detaillensis]